MGENIEMTEKIKLSSMRKSQGSFKGMHRLRFTHTSESNCRIKDGSNKQKLFGHMYFFNCRSV